MKHTALITGITGVVGGALARELSSKDGWKVLGVSRRTPALPLHGVEYLQLDLREQQSLVQEMTSLKEVTHLFYCGRATHAEQIMEDVQENLLLLENLLNIVKKASKDLKHVHLVQGGKYYGVHVGAFPTPAFEDDPRTPILNFNYDQQDLILDRSASGGWSWTISRPNTLIHFSPKTARNIISTLGAYAALCRELGAALDFPEPAGAFESLTQVTSLDLLAKGDHLDGFRP